MARVSADLAALAARIDRVEDMTPEQLVTTSTDETAAVLVDQWTRTHALRAVTVIGRDPSSTIAVLQTSVSRTHAEIRRDGERDAWTIVDLGSRNGTFLDGVQVPAHTPQPLGDRQFVGIGEVELVFVLDRVTLPERPDAGSLATQATRESVRSAPLLRLSTPTREGSGIVTYGDATISLGTAQFALLHTLAQRHLSSRGEAPGVRGFVRSIELLTDLPWNSPHPEDNHIKQQVRRLRRALERLGLPDAIESRHGFGYRLRVEPRLE
jgi:pSer/pThr/pTyr-binding forkhead associated (FHA) protein